MTPHGKKYVSFIKSPSAWHNTSVRKSIISFMFCGAVFLTPFISVNLGLASPLVVPCEQWPIKFSDWSKMSQMTLCRFEMNKLAIELGKRGVYKEANKFKRMANKLSSSFNKRKNTFCLKQGSGLHDCSTQVDLCAGQIAMKMLGPIDGRIGRAAPAIATALAQGNEEEAAFRIRQAVTFCGN